MIVALLAVRVAHFYCDIVSSLPPDEAIPTLREWLRNEARLGVDFVAVSETALAALKAAQRPEASRGPAPAPGRVTAPTGVAPPVAPSTRPIPSGDQRTLTPAAPPRAPLAPRGPAPGLPAPAPTGLPLVTDDAGLPEICSTELDAAAAAARLAALDAGFVKDCRRCGLCAGRTQTVFGVGTPRPELVFVGEGPGADEDAQGEPFVGRAGQLLTRMIAAMTLSREQVYICNVVKCRPPSNRTPTPDEMAACSPFLFRQLAILRPRVIVTLGVPATQTLLATRAGIGRLRGIFHDFPPPALAHLGLPPCRLMPTFHPAYLLRSPTEKGKAWEDLKQVMRFLGLKVPGE